MSDYKPNVLNSQRLSWQFIRVTETVKGDHQGSQKGKTWNFDTITHVFTNTNNIEEQSNGESSHTL